MKASSKAKPTVRNRSARLLLVVVNASKVASQKRAYQPLSLQLPRISFGRRPSDQGLSVPASCSESWMAPTCTPFPILHYNVDFNRSLCLSRRIC